MEISKLQKDIYNIVKKSKYSFSAGNIPAIIKGTLKKTGEKSFITRQDVLETIVNAEFNNIYGNSLKEDKTLSKLLSNLVKHNKISNYKKSFNASRMSESKRNIINNLFDKFSKDSNFKIQNRDDFSFVMSELLDRIGKSITIGNMERYGYVKTKEGWKSNKVRQASLFDSIEDVIIDNSKNDLDNLKSAIIDNLLLKKTNEREFVEEILTDKVLSNILNQTFDGDISKALKTINNESNIENLIQEHIKNIYGMEVSITEFMNTLKQGKEIVIITDDDNDGNSFLAAIKAWKKTLPEEYQELIKVFPAEILPTSETSHGINASHLKKLIKEGKIDTNNTGMLMTVDNGMSLTSEHVEKIVSLFNGLDRFRVTDHHLPSEGLSEETEIFKITNPKYNPIPFFEGKMNISGAQVGIEILKEVSIQLNIDPDLDNTIEHLNEIIRFSNLADIVTTDLFYYPLKEYEIEKYSTLSALSNTSNNMKGLVGNNIKVKSFADTLNIPKDEAEGILNQLNRLNNIASKYLDIHEELFDKGEKIKSTFEDFESKFSDILSDVTDSKVTNINYMSKLRPLLIDLTTNKQNSLHETFFLKKLTEVYNMFRNIQKKIVLKIQENPYNFIEKEDGLKTKHMEVMVIKNDALKLGITRKLLNIALNDVNNGVRIILDSKKSNTMGGSGRFVIPHKDIFSSEDAKIQGHSFAAGTLFTTKSTNTKDKIKEMVELLNKKEPIVEKLIEEQKLESVQFVFPTEKADLLQRINASIKGKLHKSYSLPTTFYLNKYEIETLKKQLSELKSDKYGYIKLDTKIMSASLIMPVGLLKKYISEVEQGKNIGIGFSSLSTDASIVDKLVDTTHSKKIDIDREFEKIFQNYIDTEFSNNKEQLTNSDLQKSAFFKYNKHGDVSFQKTQAVIITLMNEMNVDVYNILDVEANGLDVESKYDNKSDRDAQLAEIGNLSVMIDKRSGTHISLKEYKSNSFLTIGKEVYVNEKEQSNFVKLSEEEIEAINNPTIDTKYDKNFIIENTETGEVFYNTKKEYFTEIYSKNIDGDKVTFNQQLIGTNTHYFVKDLFDYMATAIESLIHLTNDFIVKNGTLLKKIDRELSNMFKSQGNFILSAHNARYDLNKIKFFLPKTWNIIKEKGIVLDSAKISQDVRSEGQQFASLKLPVNIGDMNPKITFKNYTGNGLSLKEFLESKEKGSELLSYTKGENKKGYVLKFIEDDLIFIDKNKNLSIVLVENVNNFTTEEIFSSLDVNLDASVSPKYSVQSLNHQLMTQILLQGLSERDIPRNYEGLDKLDIFDNEFKQMLGSYRFELDKSQNINNFLRLLSDKYKKQNPDSQSISGEEIIKAMLTQVNENVFVTENENRIAQGERQLTSKQSEKMVDNMFIGFIIKLEEEIAKFITNNKEISAIYTNRFHFEDIISLLPDELSFINENIIKKISYETSYPIEVIEGVINLVKEFEKTNGINIFKIEEIHNNIIAKLTELMGDAAMEGLLVLTHLINEKYNPLSKRRLIDDATSNVKLGILRSAPLVFKMDYKDTFLVKQIQDKNVLKVDSSFFPSDTLVYANLPQDMPKKEIKELVTEIEMHAFLRNLRNAEGSIYSNIYNKVSKNENNFFQSFTSAFKLNDLGYEITAMSGSFTFFNSYDLKIIELEKEISELKEDVLNFPEEEELLIAEISELEILHASLKNINDKLLSGIELPLEEKEESKKYTSFTNMYLVKEQTENNIFVMENMVNEVSDVNNMITQKFKTEIAEIDTLKENIQSNEDKLSIVDSIIDFHTISLELRELKKELKKNPDNEELSLNIEEKSEYLKEINKLRKKYTTEEKELEEEIKSVIKEEKIKTVEGIKEIFKIEDINNLNNFQELTATKEDLTNLIKYGNDKLEKLDNDLKTEISKVKDGVNSDIVEDLGEIPMKLREQEHFLNDIEYLYAKSYDLHVSQKLMSNIESIISSPEKDLVEKYSIEFDYSIFNRKIKIMEDVQELFIELFKVNDESFNDTAISSKYISRKRKTNDFVFLPEEEIAKFRNEMEIQIDKTISQLCLETEENDMGFKFKLMEQVDFLLSSYFSNSKDMNNMLNDFTSELKNELQETKVKMTPIVKIIENINDLKKSLSNQLVGANEIISVMEIKGLIKDKKYEEIIEIVEKFTKKHINVENIIKTIEIAKSFDGNPKKVNDPSKTISEKFNFLMDISKYVEKNIDLGKDNRFDGKDIKIVKGIDIK